MKWCFPASESIFFKELWWKIAQQVVREGDECLILIDGKIVEYGKKYSEIPKQVKFFSKVDWCIKNYDQNKKNPEGLSWRELFPDFFRYRPATFNYKNSIETISQLYQFLDFVFQSEKPDVVVSGCPSNLFEQIIYHFSQKHKVSHLGLTESILDENRIDVFDLEYTNSQIQPTFKQLEENDISEKEKKFSRDYIDKLLFHKKLPSYMRAQQIYLSKFELFRYYLHRLRRLNKKKGILLEYFSKRRRFQKYDYRSEIILKHTIFGFWEDIKRQFRIFSQKRMFHFLNENDSFFLYPLHFQPEFSTSILATYYTDQLATIRNIAFSLPFPYKLYVKEHPSAVGIKPNEFYQKLKQIPNVVLISAEEKVQNLIKKCSGVVTLTSTVGMEAALAGKPVYVLGKVFYMYHPLCKRMQNFDDLRKTLELDRFSKPDITNLESINLRFITSFLRNTIMGNIISGASNHDTNDYKTIYRDLKKIIMR